MDTATIHSIKNKIRKLEGMTVARGCTPAEEANAKTMIAGLRAKLPPEPERTKGAFPWEGVFGSGPRGPIFHSFEDLMRQTHEEILRRHAQQVEEARRREQKEQQARQGWMNTEFWRHLREDEVRRAKEAEQQKTAWDQAVEDENRRQEQARFKAFEEGMRDRNLREGIMAAARNPDPQRLRTYLDRLARENYDRKERERKRR